VFVPNAGVLVAACVVLIIAPANGRVAILFTGLAVMLVTNLILMRWAFAPLQRLFSAMRTTDPLTPGRRLEVDGRSSEVTELTRAFNEMLDRVERERRDSARRALAAQEAERRRVAHELHDQVGQSLTALMLDLERIGRAAPPEIADEVTELKETTVASLDDVRRIARRLRPEALDDLGLASALISLSDRVEQASDSPLDRRIDRNLPPLPPETELVIYRIAQESLTNAVRHGQPPIALSLTHRRGHVRLTTTDAGPGFDPDLVDRLGGIRGMRERALLIGARLTIASAPDSFTRVSLDVEAGG
jgi:two-component system sensor histidine kinase UhpB